MSDGMLREPQTWFTTREAAEYLRMTPEAVRKAVERGRLKSATNSTMGRRFGHRFRREALDAFITGEHASYAG